MGRVANRIGGAKFSLNGVEYKLPANDGNNTLHGYIILTLYNHSFRFLVISICFSI